MSRTAVHQVVPILLHSDAIGDETRTIRSALRARGLESEIYSLRQPVPYPGQDDSALPLDALLSTATPPAAVLYHYAISSEATGALIASRLPVVLIHHNLTPPRWFHMVDPQFEANLAAAEAELPRLAGHVRLALADSEFSRRELEAMGFAPTGVLPILLDQQPYLDHTPGPRFEEIKEAPTLLSVGRVAPNKRIDDCIRLLLAYREGVDARARLWVVGDTTRLPVHREALDRLVTTLGLGDAVRFLGRVPQRDLLDCYQGALAYVSMSEHEGFSVPLVESMLCGLPILAYPSTAVPFTLGDAGLQVPVKDFPLMAEGLAALLRDEAELAEHVARGRRRAAELSPERALAHLVGLLSGALDLPLTEARTD